MTTLRFALRSLVRTPRLSLAAVACIGLGAAATTAVSTLVAATVLRPLPFPAADRLVRLWWEEDGNPRVSLSIPELRDAASLRSFDVLLATARVRAVAVLDGGAQRMRGEGVSPGYFESLGLRPHLGRLLADEDHRPGAPRVIVISHALWTGSFGADPAVVGRTFRTERAAYTIAGVGPAGFQGTVEPDVVTFWIPLSQYEPAAMLEERRTRQSWAIGRLREGTGLGAAAAEVAALGGALAERHPVVYRRLRLRVEPMGENWRGGFRASGLLLAGSAVLLLLVAATNVAGLLLARVIERRRELAVRAALGADRGRLVRQLLLEAAILVAAGSALGMLVAPAVLRAFLALSPVALPAYVQVAPDARALLVSIAALAVTGLLAGTAPAIFGSRVAPGEALKEDGRGTVGGRAERRAGGLLVAGEVALTLVLLVAGALLLRSWERLEKVPLGYRTEGLARLAFALSRQDVPETSAVPAFRERVRATLLEHPGVQEVGLVWLTLPPWDAERFRIRFAGLDPAVAEEGLDVGGHLADHGLLPALGIPILAGRNFEPADAAAGAHVALVSRSVAERMGGVAAAVGRELVVPGRDPAMPSGAFQVVGVAENVAWDGRREQDTDRMIRFADRGDRRAGREDVYLPLALYPLRTVSAAVSMRGDAAAALEPLRRRIASVAPTSAVQWTSTMREELALEVQPARFYALLVTAFSTSALLLTAVGVFAVLSHGVSRRTGEIGLRMALGARAVDIAWLVLESGSRALGAGVVAGLAGAVVLGRAVSGVLYEVPPLDGAAFAAATAVLLLVALPAGLLPARRASRLQPMAALRGR
jgi:putative ABC transport system permease protein